jgi:hypothetical protein
MRNRPIYNSEDTSAQKVNTDRNQVKIMGSKTTIYENGAAQPHIFEISDNQIEILARRLLPVIKRFFADESIQEEFEEWLKKKQKI